MASFASSATTCGARKHAWTKSLLWFDMCDCPTHAKSGYFFLLYWVTSSQQMTDEMEWIDAGILFLGDTPDY